MSPEHHFVEPSSWAEDKAAEFTLLVPATAVRHLLFRQGTDQEAGYGLPVRHVQALPDFFSGGMP